MELLPQISQQMRRCVLLPAIAVLLPLSLTGSQLLSDDFTAGMQPAWTVVDEGAVAAPSNWWVPPGVGRLRQESKISGNATDPLLQPGTSVVAGQLDWSNYSFTAKLKANNLDLSPGAMGIVFGYRDSKNFYRFSMDRKASGRRLIKVVNGLATLLASDGVVYDLGRFYTLEAKLTQARIEIWLDQQLLFNVVDTSHLAGKIGLYTSDHGGVAFDDVLVTQLPPASCTYSITPSQATAGAAASTAAVAVTAPTGCGYTARSNSSWITITSSGQDIGDGVATYSVAANIFPTPRQGSLTIAGSTFPVSQDPGPTAVQLLSDYFTSGMQPIWTVVDEGTLAAPSKWWVAPGARLRQESKIRGTDPLLQPGTYLLAGQADWTDYSFTAKKKANNLDLDPGSMGIMFGYRDSKNYYRFSMDRKTPARRLVKVVNGVPSLLAYDSVPYDLSRFYTVEARMVKGKIEISVDWQLLFEVTDSTHESGKIALYASDHGGVAVDYVLVSGLNPVVCTYSITPSEVTVGAGGSTGTVSVTGPNACSWTAKSNNPWVTLTSGFQGKGNGVVSYSVQANSAPTSREGSLTVAGLAFAISQAPACTYSITPAQVSVGAAATTGSVAVTAPSGCGWTATSNTAWASITAGSDGIGDGVVAYSVQANGATTPRQGSLTIAGISFTISQGRSCTYSITPAQQTVGAAAGTGTVAVTAPSGCGWTAASNTSWATITSGGQGTGDGVVAYSVNTNRFPTPRVGSLTIAGINFALSQDPGPVVTQLLSDYFTSGLQPIWTVVDEGTLSAPSNWWVPPVARLRQESKIRGTDPLLQPGTYLLVGQTDWTDYSFTAKMKANNLDLNPGAMGIMFGYKDPSNYYRFSMDRKTPARRLVKVVNGVPTVLASDSGTYDLSRFYTLEARMVNGKIEVSVDWQLLFEVTDTTHQSGKVALYASDHGGLAVDYALVAGLNPVCTYSFSPSEITVGAGGSTGTVAVTAPSTCSWTANSNDPWVTLTSGAQGQGNGAVSYSVQSNGATTPRQGSLTIAGLNIAVSQEPSLCTYSITPTQTSVSAAASTGAVAVTAPSGCVWTATSNVPWAAITSGASGTGDGVIAYSVAANSGTARQGSLTIASLDFEILQAATLLDIYVPAGGDLQAALDQIQPGRTITLEPGAEYVGHFVLRNKPGTEYITITTADPSKLPPAGKRITPAHAPGLPKIATPDEYAAITTEPGAHHYRLVGLEIRPSAKYAFELVTLGSGQATSIAEQAKNIELDRLYLHGNPALGTKRGVALNSGYTVIRNSHFSDFKGEGQDTQAIAGWNGPGPYEIINNYLEAAGENIIFGGVPPKIEGIVPSDITIRKNHFYKPLEWCRYSNKWDGSYWIIKNLLELKMARRVTIEGNVFENNWQQAQAGFAIVLTVRAEKIAHWAVVEDIDIVRNIVKHSGSGVNILGMDGNSNDMGIARRILIKDNLFEDIDYTKWKGDGRVFQLLNGAQKVTIDHNTVISDNVKMMMMFDGSPTLDFVFKNNIVPHGASGVIGSGKAIGNATLNHYAPGAVFTRNALVGGASRSSLYPPGNFFPESYPAINFVNYGAGNYALSDKSPYANAGTDNRDIGADIAAVLAATAGAVAP
jgi:hypothetical protein